MSRAFVKEDAEVVERTTRRRTASGLPPGALNYMTAAGAGQLRARLASLQSAGRKNLAEIEELERLLASVTIVEPQAQRNVVTFGAAVTLQRGDGTTTIHRIVGVDEVALVPDSVSWVSPLGRALLGTEIGQRVRLDEASNETGTVVKVE